jgi:hypothetical protein
MRATPKASPNEIATFGDAFSNTCAIMRVIMVHERVKPLQVLKPIALNFIG